MRSSAWKKASRHAWLHHLVQTVDYGLQQRRGESVRYPNQHAVKFEVLKADGVLRGTGRPSPIALSPW